MAIIAVTTNRPCSENCKSGRDERLEADDAGMTKRNP